MMIRQPLAVLLPLACAGVDVTFVPFDDFIAGVKASTHVGAMSSNAVNAYNVRDESAFNEMRDHILSHYEGVNVTRSFLDVHHFDCVHLESQPSLRGNKPASPPPGMLDSAAARNVERHQDVFCESGTIPMLRVSFERMLRHATLAHFFAKTPQGPRPYQVSDNPHKYAHGSQQVRNIGGESSLGIWNPQGYFTLSQQWYTAFTQNGTIQSAECGNVHYSGFGPDAVLFIYATTNGYAENSGCYNLDCQGFVQTDHSYTLGKAWTNYSSDGHRVAHTYSFQLFNGNWWFALDGHYIGYYPAALYQKIDATAMAVGATSVDFGGETFNNGVDDWPQMGSGKFADAGWSHAAAHSNIRYYYTDTDGPKYVGASLTTDQESSSCYTIDAHDQDADSGTWFTFGGPGGSKDGCNSVVESSVVLV